MRRLFDRSVTLSIVLSLIAIMNIPVWASGLSELHEQIPNTDDIRLYGAPRNASIVHHLHAGAISVKFQDGELRYLYVNDKEIIRRVYFGVRDDLGDTVMPDLSAVTVRSTVDSFTITFKAACKNDIADYSWNGEIIGAADGRITFKVDGAANTDFKSPRIGLNILYGTGSLSGQPYSLVDDKGTVTSQTFPENVSSTLLADFNSFKTLEYTTADGLSVSSSLDSQCIGMEDQRTYGDSSYKAFSSMRYSYPNVVKGERRSQVFNMEVRNSFRKAAATRPIQVVLGQAVEGAKIPKFVTPVAESTKSFGAYNGDREKYADAELITLPFNPTLHMPDDDTLMENIPTVLDWIHSIRAFAPRAKFQFDQIGFNSPYPRPAADPRNVGLFSATWCARVVKYLALGGVDEAGFIPNGKYAQAALSRLLPYVGYPVLQTTISPGTPAPVDALAVARDGKTVVWLMNLTNEPQQVALKGLSKRKHLRITRISTESASQSNLSSLTLSPFDILEIVSEN